MGRIKLPPGALQLPGGSITCTLGLLALFGELSIRRARVTKLAFEMTNPAAQKLALLAYLGQLTLGLLERAGGLVRRRLRYLHSVSRLLHPMPSRAANSSPAGRLRIS